MSDGQLETGAALAVSDEGDAVMEHYARRLQGAVTPVIERLSGIVAADAAAQLQLWRDRFRSLADGEGAAIVSHPFFSYYWLQLMQAYGRGDRQFLTAWSFDLGRFVALPYLSQSPAESIDLRLADESTEIRFPNYPSHLRFSAGVQMVRIGPDGDGTVRSGIVRLPLEFVMGQAGTQLGSVERVGRRSLAATAIDIDSSDAWIRRHLASMNTKPPMEGYPAPDLAPSSPTPVQLAGLDAAYGLAERVWPEVTSEFKQYVRLVVPYHSRFHSSFTEACLMGAVFLSEAKWPFTCVEYTAEHLVHEAAHLRLTLLLELDPLLSGAKGVDFSSPVRRDPRPLSAMLQTAFAFARIAAFHRRASDLEDGSFHEARHKESVGLLDRSLRAVEAEDSVCFTPLGEKLWGEMSAEARLT